MQINSIEIELGQLQWLINLMRARNFQHGLLWASCSYEICNRSPISAESVWHRQVTLQWRIVIYMLESGSLRKDHIFEVMSRSDAWLGWLVELKLRRFQDHTLSPGKISGHVPVAASARHVDW